MIHKDPLNKLLKDIYVYDEFIFDKEKAFIIELFIFTKLSHKNRNINLANAIAYSYGFNDGRLKTSEQVKLITKKQVKWANKTFLANRYLSASSINALVNAGLNILRQTMYKKEFVKYIGIKFKKYKYNNNTGEVLEYFL